MSKMGKMDEEMEDVCEKVCVFEERLEIDFEYEFDVSQYFDFSRDETPEEIAELEQWFYCSSGHPPSPLVAVYWGKDGSGDSEVSSTKCGDETSTRRASEVYSLDQGKKGKQFLKSKSQSSVPLSSRLLQPTASLLAKQNQHIDVRSTRSTARLQKLGSLLKIPGENLASKRQKLERGYLRKVAQLKHQTTFSHKTPNMVGTADVKSRSKVTVPKEPKFETAQRAERHRFKKATNPVDSHKIKSCPTTPRLSEKCDAEYKFKADPLNKKIFSSRGDIGISRKSKLETTVTKEFKLSSSKKLTQNPPIELFSKLSLKSDDRPSSVPEDKKPAHIQEKGSKSNRQSSIMKENKVPNTAKSSRSCMAQSQFRGGRSITEMGAILAVAGVF